MCDGSPILRHESLAFAFTPSAAILETGQQKLGVAEYRAIEHWKSRWARTHQLFQCVMVAFCSHLLSVLLMFYSEVRRMELQGTVQKEDGPPVLHLNPTVLWELLNYYTRMSNIRVIDKYKRRTHRGIASEPHCPTQYTLDWTIKGLTTLQWTTVYRDEDSKFHMVCIHSRQPHTHDIRSSRSCASKACASGKRGEISHSKETGRLCKYQISIEPEVKIQSPYTVRPWSSNPSKSKGINWPNASFLRSILVAHRRTAISMKSELFATC